MVDLRAVELAVVNVLATAQGCDAVAPVGGFACRVAPDELLLFGGDTLAAATTAATEADPDALVMDVTDGWAAWRLEGAEARAAFSRLSELHLPDEGFVQGEVTRLPVKVLVDATGITLLVPAMWGSYLRERVLADCASLGVTEAAAS